MLQCNQLGYLPQRDIQYVWSKRRITLCLVALLTWAGITASVGRGEESEFAGLIRGKGQDRTSYQAPILTKPTPTNLQSPVAASPTAAEAIEEPVRADAPPTLVRERVRQVGYHSESAPRPLRASYGADAVYEQYVEPSFDSEPSCGLEPGCGCEAAGYACDGSCFGGAAACGSCGGCDSIGCAGNCSQRLCLDPCQWFGSVELMMMWRVGDGLPVLATTSTNAAGTGVLGAASTRTLFGGERVLDDLTAGGRVTIGTWLDSQHCRSLVFRGWGAEQESFNFFTDENRDIVIARPFFNVTDGITPANGSQLIAAPNQFDGSIHIDGSNNVYGGDVSLRQRWLGGLGGYVDVLYGYQYMRMEDDLNISTSSTVLPGNVNEGAILDVIDRFDAENEFHGAQLGLAARYRERCWSFNGTLKAAAGSLNRTAFRSGSTNRSLAGVTAPDPNGLLVRSTNAGTSNDNTFAWVPELDATLGWRWTQNLDLTFGYHVVAMTDALQVSGMIDENLAVNAANNPTGTQRPNGLLRYDTFYVHGIHFGVQCVY